MTSIAELLRRYLEWRSANARRNLNVALRYQGGFVDIASIAAPIIGGLIGGGMSSQPVSSSQYTYVPPNQAGMAQNWQNYYGQMQGLLPSYYGQIQPMAASALQAAYYNPYASSYQAGAGNVASAGQNAATQAQNAASGIYAASVDPQQALYSRTLQQIQDQARAANAAAGIGTSAAGVGLENQAVDNFNINWQNQQLQRQMQGAQAAGNVNNQGLNMLMGTYGVPYQVAGQIPANQQAALGQYAAAAGAYPAAINQQLNQAANYLQLGQAAQNNAFNQAYNNAQAQNQQAAAIGSGIAGAYQNYQNNQLLNNMINNYQYANNPYYGWSSNPGYSASNMTGSGNWFD